MLQDFHYFLFLSLFPTWERLLPAGLQQLLPVNILKTRNPAATAIRTAGNQLDTSLSIVPLLIQCL